MKVARKRILQDDRGASMIIALLFLLICTVVAAILLNAASGNAERAHQQTMESQSYLQVSSAAELTRDLFVPSTSKADSAGVDTSGYTFQGSTTSVGKSPFGTWIRTCLAAKQQGGVMPTHTIYLDASSGAPQSFTQLNERVRATCTMKDDLTIVVSLVAVDRSNVETPGLYQLPITVTMPLQTATGQTLGYWSKAETTIGGTL
jgi:hypothetical protein